MTAEWAGVWVQVAYAVITLLIFVAAVWGDLLRRRWAGARLAVCVNNPAGVLVPRGNGRRVWFFHLRVRNRRRYSTGVATVTVTKLEYCNERGVFVPEVFPGPLPLLWAYSEVYGVQRTVGAEAVCDLGFIDEGASAFVLALAVRPNNVTGAIQRGQVARVHLVAEVDGYPQRESCVLEISWNGEWSDDAASMFANVKIAALPAQGAR